MFNTLNSILHGNVNGSTLFYILGFAAAIAVYIVAFASPARMGSR